MTRRLQVLVLLALAISLSLVPGKAHAQTAEKREIVMVLDTSGSMGQQLCQSPRGPCSPPSDPDRLSILGTQMIVSLLSGSADDEVTVFGFPAVKLSANDLTSLQFGGATPYLPALDAALDTLSRHSDRRRVLIFLTDGQPTDDKGQLLDLSSVSAHALPIINLPTHAAIIGLLPGGAGQREIEPFLKALAGGQADDVRIVQDRSQIVPQLTQALAHAFDSEPESGVFDSDSANYSFDIGAGVNEVLIALAADSPGDTFQGQLSAQDGSALAANSAWGSGYNSDNPATRRYWQTLRYDNRSNANSKPILRALHAHGKVQYGIIYKYDLVVALETASAIEGSNVDLVAHLRSGTATLDKASVDRSGFASPQFSVDGVPVPQALLAADGSLRATWLAKRPAQGSSVKVRVTVQGPHGSLSGEGVVSLRQATKLQLNLPASLDFGAWTPSAEWWRGPAPEAHCQVIDLQASPGAEAVPLQCRAENWPKDAGQTLACSPDPNSRASGAGEFLRWQVCVAPKPCCGPMKSSAAASATLARVIFSGRDPAYQSVSAPVAVYFDVSRPNWLRCYWPWIALACGILFTFWTIRGIVTPNSFSTDSAFHIAGSEAGLRKNQANMAVEAPGGKRGFYRDARVAVNSSGDLVRDPRLAVLVVTATRGSGTRVERAAGLEKKDARTGKWVAVPEKDFDAGLLAKAIYRVAQLYIKWE